MKDQRIPLKPTPPLSDNQPAAKSGRAPRIVWIDYARAFAILTVILCHSTEATYSFQVSNFQAASIFSQLSALTCFTVGRLGVPIFLFMSGYLMLDRSYDEAGCRKFWRSKWIALVLATEVWIVVYNIFLCAINDTVFDPARLFRNMLFIENVGMGHIWYMPMIIGLYLFLPFIANGLKRIDNPHLLLFPLTIACTILFVVPIASILSQCVGEAAFKSEIADGFSGGAYGCYMLLGYCVKKRSFDSLPSFGIALLGGISFVLTIGFQLFAYNNGVFAPVWYTNALLLLSGLSLFLLVSRMSFLREAKAVFALSYYSFALYLVHFPVKILLTPFVQALHVSHLAEVGILSLLVLVVSLAACALIARIPKIGARILYLR